MKKIKLILPALALILGLTVVFTQSAFKSNTKKADVYWQYNQNSDAGIRTGTNYTLTSAPDEVGCDGSELPCVLRVDESIDTQAELDTYLHNTTMFPNPSDITSAAYSTKDGL